MCRRFFCCFGSNDVEEEVSENWISTWSLYRNIEDPPQFELQSLVISRNQHIAIREQPERSSWLTVGSITAPRTAPARFFIRQPFNEPKPSISPAAAVATRGVWNSTLVSVHEIDEDEDNSFDELPQEAEEPLYASINPNITLVSVHEIDEDEGNGFDELPQESEEPLYESINPNITLVSVHEIDEDEGNSSDELPQEPEEPLYESINPNTLIEQEEMSNSDGALEEPLVGLLEVPKNAENLEEAAGIGFEILEVPKNAENLEEAAGIGSEMQEVPENAEDLEEASGLGTLARKPSFRIKLNQNRVKLCNSCCYSIYDEDFHGDCSATSGENSPTKPECSKVRPFSNFSLDVHPSSSVANSDDGSAKVDPANILGSERGHATYALEVYPSDSEAIDVCDEQQVDSTTSLE